MKFNKLESFQVNEKITTKVLPEYVGNLNESINSNRFIDIINKTKEFLRLKSVNLRLGAMVLVAMGSMEVVQAQDGEMSKFRDAIDGIKSGKYNTTQATDLIYNSYTEKNNDSTYFVKDISSYHKDGKIINENITFSGQKLSTGNMNDTIFFGEVDVKSYFVKTIQSDHNFENKKEVYKENEDFRLFEGIKINVEGDNSIIQTEKSHIEYGENLNGTIISAMTNVIGFRSCYVKSLTSRDLKSESISTEKTNDYKEKDQFIDLTTVESHGILKNVKVVIKKIFANQPDKFHIFHKDMKNKEKIKDQYQVEVIYSE